MGATSGAPSAAAVTLGGNDLDATVSLVRNPSED